MPNPSLGPRSRRDDTPVFSTADSAPPCWCAENAELARHATTGIDNNGDGATNDRPVIDGDVVGRAAFRGSSLYDVTAFVEGELGRHGRGILLRAEVFNLLNHGNVLGRMGVYGDAAAPNAAFGTPNTGIANLDPARMVQFEVRFVF